MPNKERAGAHGRRRNGKWAWACVPYMGLIMTQEKIGVLPRVMSTKITEDEISTRLAVEKLGLGIATVKKKRRYRIKDPVLRESERERCIRQGWQKGHSGNPKGRPINALSLTALLNKKLAENPSDAEAIVNALIALGKGKDMRAIEMSFERIDGKVVEKHEISGEMPVTIRFVPAEQLLAPRIREMDKTNQAYGEIEREEMRRDEIDAAPEPLKLEDGGVERKS